MAEEVRIVLIGLVGSARGLGMFAFTLGAGALADRFDRRTVLLWTQGITLALQLGIVGVMLAGPNPATLVVFFLLVLLSTATFAADLPIRQSIVPDVVGADRAASGIALCAAATHIVAPPSLIATGFLVDELGFAGSYGLTVLGSALALATLLPLHYRTRWDPARREAPGLGRTVRDIGTALAYARSHRPVYWVLVLMTTILVLVYPAVANLGPTWITTVIGQSIRNFGFIATAWSVAAFAAALALTRYRGTGQREPLLLAVSSAAFAASFVVFAVPAVPFAVLGNIGLGAALAAMQIASASLVQRLVPNELRARMLTLLALSLGTAQVFTLPAALVGQAASLEVLFPLLAAASVAVLLPVLVAASRVWRRIGARV